MRQSFYGNSPMQEDDKNIDRHFFLSKILIPFGSLLVAGILLLTSNYQLPKWVFIFVVLFLALVSAYIVIIIGPLFKKGLSSMQLSIQKKRNRTRFSKYYLPHLNEKYNEFSKFLEDRSDNVIYLIQTVGAWPEILDKQNKYDTFDLEQLSNHVRTLREWLQVVQYTLQNSGVGTFRLAAYNFSRLISQYYRLCLDWQKRFDNAVRQGRIQGDHLRHLKQEWFTHREKITKYIDQWKPLAGNINAIYEENICIDYFETLKTVE